MSATSYAGKELPLFAGAHNWKAYVAEQIASAIKGDVLEVGAGIGGMTRVLRQHHEGHWLCLEPDVSLLAQIPEVVKPSPPPETRAGRVADLAAEESFDCILYLDVLEHIADDADELTRAVAHLRPEGHLVILVPAHARLMSPFDVEIGHHRRYDRASLQLVIPPGLNQVMYRYLDAAGVLASLANAYLLRQSEVKEAQIRFWDRYLVTISRWLDPLFGYCLGKSLCGIWQYRAADKR